MSFRSKVVRKKPVPQTTKNNLFTSETMNQIQRVTSLYIDPSVSELVKHALKDPQIHLSSTGALLTLSGEKTGRSPKDKRIVSDDSTKNIWWGNVNVPISPKSFEFYKSKAISLIRNYEINGYSGWDEKNNVKIKLYTNLPYHALFMKNLLVSPSSLANQGLTAHEFIIYDAGEINLPESTIKDRSLNKTLIAINFTSMEAVIFGTKYAGEIKKLILTLMMYLMPLRGHLPLHSSANISGGSDLTLFFGLSGSGKTSLSTDSCRILIGDDEHVWTNKGIFNIEGGCYAKCINLSLQSEPDIFNAIKYGAVLENVVHKNFIPDYSSDKITENTRCAYPLSFIPNALIPAITNTHPTNIILLVCDSFGVLPPVAKLTIEQAVYFFISGYTSKIAGTEQGIKSPEAVFSACFGEPFLVWQPKKYGDLLAKKLSTHGYPNIWLLNTGWINGPYGVGKRIPIKYSRTILNRIHDGSLEKEDRYLFSPNPGGDSGPGELQTPVKCDGIEENIFNPRELWEDKEKYDKQLSNLYALFDKNYNEKLSGSLTGIGSG